MKVQIFSLKVETEDAVDSMIVSELPVYYPHEIAIQNELFRFRTYTEVSSILLGSISSFSATQVCVIDLAGQGLGDYRVIQILNRIYGLQLKHLALGRNGLTDEALFRLAVILPSLTQLTTLNLSENKIRDIGIRTLFGDGVLPRSLKHLDLSKNCFGHFAAYYIGRLFTIEDSKQPHLDSLYLGGSRIQGGSIDFMRILVSFLAGSNNRSLSQLSVPFMSFSGPAGIETLASFIACNGAIVDLNVSNNPFLTGDCYSFFRWSVACNPSIRNVFLGQCGLSQFDKSLIASAATSAYKPSWGEKTRVCILVSQELSKCAFARYLLEYKGMNNWKAERPVDWQVGLPFLNDDYDHELFLPLLNPPWACDSSAYSAVPFFLTELVKCVNAAWTLMTYLEGVFSECEAAEYSRGGLADESDDVEFRAERIFTSAELRQKKERVVAANLLLRDFSYSADANDKQAMELLCMSLEDLLSTLVHHEHSLSSKIVHMYSAELESRFNCKLRGIGPVPDALYRHIPFYRYIGDAALYIHLLYIARPFKVAMRLRAAAVAVEQAKESAESERKASRKVMARKSKQVQSKIDGEALIDNDRPAAQQRVIYRFVPNDRGLFVKLATLRLEPSEGERALFSSSRTNQRLVANEFKLFRPASPAISLILEQETERGQLMHLSVHNIDAGERTVMAAYRADVHSERRCSCRMSDLSL